MRSAYDKKVANMQPVNSQITHEERDFGYNIIVCLRVFCVRQGVVIYSKAEIAKAEQELLLWFWRFIGAR